MSKTFETVTIYKLENPWTDSTGDCYAYKYGKIVYISIRIQLLQGITINALSIFNLRVIPIELRPNGSERFYIALGNFVEPGTIAPINFSIHNGNLICQPYRNITGGGYEWYALLSYLL